MDEVQSKDSVPIPCVVPKRLEPIPTLDDFIVLDEIVAPIVQPRRHVAVVEQRPADRQSIAAVVLDSDVTAAKDTVLNRKVHQSIIPSQTTSRERATSDRYITSPYVQRSRAVEDRPSWNTLIDGLSREL